MVVGAGGTAAEAAAAAAAAVLAAGGTDEDAKTASSNASETASAVDAAEVVQPSCLQMISGILQKKGQLESLVEEIPQQELLNVCGLQLTT